MLKHIKKLNLILVLCLLVFYSKADESRKALDKDVSSGYTNLTKSLKGKDYKDYGMQVVSKAEGFPVRNGGKSIRFEVRMGDCNPDNTKKNMDGVTVIMIERDMS